jgi:hypothetical protein
VKYTFNEECTTLLHIWFCPHTPPHKSIFILKKENGKNFIASNNIPHNTGKEEWKYPN